MWVGVIGVASQTMLDAFLDRYVCQGRSSKLIRKRYCERRHRVYTKCGNALGENSRCSLCATCLQKGQDTYNARRAKLTLAQQEAEDAF